MNKVIFILYPLKVGDLLAYNSIFYILLCNLVTCIKESTGGIYTLCLYGLISNMSKLFSVLFIDVMVYPDSSQSQCHNANNQQSEFAG